MQMAVEFDKLKAALAAETVNTENERNAKIEVSIERLTEWLSMSERELVDHWANGWTWEWLSGSGSWPQSFLCVLSRSTSFGINSIYSSIIAFGVH